MEKYFVRFDPNGHESLEKLDLVLDSMKEPEFGYPLFETRDDAVFMFSAIFKYIEDDHYHNATDLLRKVCKTPAQFIDTQKLVCMMEHRKKLAFGRDPQFRLAMTAEFHNFAKELYLQELACYD